MPERIDGRPLPVVEIVDLGETRAETAPNDALADAKAAASPARPRKKGGGLFSPPLLDGLAAALTRGDQALVFLNRRGHTRVASARTAASWRVPVCDVSLT